MSFFFCIAKLEFDRALAGSAGKQVLLLVVRDKMAEATN